MTEEEKRYSWYIKNQLWQHTTEKGITFSGLARMIKYRPSQIQKYLQGGGAAFETVSLIAKALEMTEKEFLGENAERSKTKHSGPRAGDSCGVAKVLKMLGPGYFDGENIVYRSHNSDADNHSRRRSGQFHAEMASGGGNAQ